VMRVTKILGILVVMCMASVAYADNITCNSSTATVSVICSAGLVNNPSDGSYSVSQAQANNASARTAFNSQSGYSNYDAINWSDYGINDIFDGAGQPPCLGSYCGNPEWWNATGPGPDAANNWEGYYPTATGPIATPDNTGYSLGMVPGSGVNNAGDLGLSATNSFLDLTPSGTNNVLSAGMYDTSGLGEGQTCDNTQCTFDNYVNSTSPFTGFALTFDTSDTGLTGCQAGQDGSGLSYNGAADTCGSGPLTGPQNSTTPLGPNMLYGVGFDLQAGGYTDGGFVPTSGYTITFDVWAAVPGCETDIDSAVDPVVDCFDYETGLPTDASGVDCGTGEGQDSSCSNQPLAQVTLCVGTYEGGSCEASSQAQSTFIGFTSTTAISAISVASSSLNGESSNSFGVDGVSLLTQQQTPIPEPASLLLFGSGLLVAARRLRSRFAK